MPKNNANPLITRLMSAWGRRPLSVRFIRSGVYRVRTSSGQYCLKRLHPGAPAPRFLVAAEKHLVSKGCEGVVGLLPARGGAHEVILNGSTWVLTEWVAGREPKARSPEDCDLVAGTLARFHRASRGFSGPARANREWLARFQSESKDLSRYLNQAAKGGTVFDRGLRSRREWILTCCERALGLLMAPGALEEIHTARTDGMLCHGDAGVGNYIIDTAGELKIIDLETLCVDHRARDLYRLIRSIMKTTGWNVDRARRVMESYHQVSPLGLIDWYLTLAWLTFPHKIWRICRRRYDLGSSGDKLTRGLIRALGTEPGVERLWREFVPDGGGRKWRQ